MLRSIQPRDYITRGGDSTLIICELKIYDQQHSLIQFNIKWIISSYFINNLNTTKLLPRLAAVSCK